MCGRPLVSESPSLRHTNVVNNAYTRYNAHANCLQSQALFRMREVTLVCILSLSVANQG